MTRVRGAHILLVFDSSAKQQQILSALTQVEYGRVSSSTSLVSAHQTMRTEHIDLVICSEILPDGTGLDLLNRKTGWYSCPVILVASAEGCGNSNAAVMAGASGVVTMSTSGLERLPIETRHALQRWPSILARRQLLEQQQQLLAIAEATSDLIGTTDIDGSITYLNSAGRRLMGLAEDADVSGMRLQDFFEDEGRQSLICDGIPCAIKNGDWRSENKIRHCDGYDIPVSQVLIAHRDGDGLVTYFSTIIRDIRRIQAAHSERDRLQGQLHQATKMESIGLLAGGVAHDFNNILTTINGYSEMALAAPDDRAFVTECIETILESGKKAASLTQKLLAYSRKQVIEPRVLQIDQVILDMQPSLTQLVGEKVALEIDLAPGLWRVKMDRSQLEQAITNLVVNAGDAMPTGGTLSISSCNRVVGYSQIAAAGLKVAGDYVSLTVCDTGEGIEESIRENIFEPFFTTKEEGKGTGLGLASVFGAMQQNFGSINVMNGPQRGAKFEILLPRTRHQVVAENPSADEHSVAVAPHGSETILLVEDNEKIRDLVLMALKDFGYRVITACDGADALKKYGKQEDAVDLLLTDVVMPKMDGARLAQSIRQSTPELPVLYMSGHSERVVNLESSGDEKVRLISKPFAMASLAREIRELLDGAPQ